MILRTAGVWAAIAAIGLVPLVAAAFSPFLQYRGPAYVIAGFAGILAMALVFLQPLLAGWSLPGISATAARSVHLWSGVALLLRSPTPFSLWGVIAMWMVFATAALALFRRHLRLRPRPWRMLHLGFGAVIAAGTVAHALLIEGTMEPVTKWMLAAAVMTATAKVLLNRRR